MPIASHRGLVLSRRPVQLAVAGIAVALLAGATRAEAQGRQARLSEALALRIQSGDFNATTVIFTGTQTRVDDLVARHGLRIKKRLRTGAVLEVPAYRLEALASDPTVDHLSGNPVVRSEMAVTVQSIG